VQREAAAEGLDAVGEAVEAGAVGEVGVAPSSRMRTRSTPASASAAIWSSMTVAAACLAVLVSASVTT
jgi:hypothetical protein